uniref:(northern house mosquito) hypothetical protein n=1 Tax=Culex pipiens TaxID=7175 RepID=A0A8D8DBN4_CULPI
MMPTPTTIIVTGTSLPFCACRRTPASVRRAFPVGRVLQEGRLPVRVRSGVRRRDHPGATREVSDCREVGPGVRPDPLALPEASGGVIGEVAERGLVPCSGSAPRIGPRTAGRPWPLPPGTRP